MIEILKDIRTYDFWVRDEDDNRDYIYEQIVAIILGWA